MLANAVWLMFFNKDSKVSSEKVALMVEYIRKNVSPLHLLCAPAIVMCVAVWEKQPQDPNELLENKYASDRLMFDVDILLYIYLL